MRVGRAFVSLLCVVGAFAIGCGDDDGGEAETHEPEAETGTIDPIRHHQAEQIPPHELAELSRLTGRVREVTGTVTIDGEPMRESDAFDAGRVIRTGEDGKVVVDLLQEMRAEIGAGTEVVRGTLREGELYLLRGTLRATLPPVGGSARPPLTIGTPAGTVNLGGAADVLVSALPSGDTWVVTFSGAAELSRGLATDEGEERRLTKLALLEGEARVLGRSAIAEATRAPARVEGGWAAAAQLVEATPAIAPRGAQALAEAARAHFDEAADWLATELARGEALANEQREVAQSDPTRARALTREIVVHSQRRSRLRQIALARFQQLVAAEGFAGAEVSAERKSRAEELLGE